MLTCNYYCNCLLAFDFEIFLFIKIKRSVVANNIILHSISVTKYFEHSSSIKTSN